jgi:hypothetical protein
MNTEAEATIYVDPIKGNDQTGDGSERRPFRSMSRAGQEANGPLFGKNIKLALLSSPKYAQHGAPNRHRRRAEASRNRKRKKN